MSDRRGSIPTKAEGKIARRTSSIRIPTIVDEDIYDQIIFSPRDEGDSARRISPDSSATEFLDPAHMPQTVRTLKMPLSTSVGSYQESGGYQELHRQERDRIRGYSGSRTSSRSSWSSTAEEYTHSLLSPYRSGYEEIGVEVATCRSRCCYCFKKLVFIFLGISAALMISVVPTVILLNKIAGVDNQDILGTFLEHPETAFPTWFALSFAVMVLLYLLFIGIRGIWRRCRKRLASLEEAVQFARETMPEYGARRSSRLSVLSLVRPY